MTVTPSMAAAEHYIALLASGDTHGASVYLDQLQDDKNVDPWTVIEAMGARLTRPATTAKAYRPRNESARDLADTSGSWNEALGASGVFGRR